MPLAQWLGSFKRAVMRETADLFTDEVGRQAGDRMDGEVQIIEACEDALSSAR